MKKMLGIIMDIGKTYREQVMYLIFGGLTTLINWLAYTVLVMAKQEIELANLIAWVAAVLFAYATNRLYVFQSKASGGRDLLKEFVLFLGSRVVTGIVEIIGFPLLYHAGLNQAFLEVDGFVAKIIISIVVVILNYVLSKVVVFRK